MTRNLTRGFSLAEIMIVLIIIISLAALFVTSFSGLMDKDEVDQVAQLIHDDLLACRSKALSANVNYRLNFLTTTTWRLEKYNEATAAWESDSDTRQMPVNIAATDLSFANAAANLEASPRGLFILQNGATGEPYITIGAASSTHTKSIHVAIGGAIEVVSN